MKLSYIVKLEDTYQNINEILSNEFNISTRLRTKLIKNNLIYKNSVITDSRSKVKVGDIITIDLSSAENNSNIVPTKMDLNIIYEDEWLIVINKPARIAIHPSQLHYNNSLSNGVRYYFDTIGLKKKIRPVNRLDFNTSGLVIFAKCEYIHECFVKQMQSGVFQKEYLCIVSGILKEKEGIINLPIARKDGSIIERCINENGQNAVTIYNVINEFKNYSLVHCKLETGRTHQIRVHMQAIGHSIVGDTLYGTSSSLINRQALHSYKISCIHPISETPLTFEIALPKDMNTFLGHMKESSSIS